MSFVVIIPRSVYEELNNVFSYYNDLQPDLGVKFLDDWENTMDHLEERPFIYQVQFKQFRSIQFNRFPFLIIYKVKENSIILSKLIHVKKHQSKRFK